MSEFTGLLESSSTRLPFEAEKAKGALAGLVKDLFPLQTLLLLGASFQCLASALLPFYLSIAPTLLMTLITLLYHFGPFAKRRHMAGAIPERFTAQLPSRKTGSFGSTPAADGIVVFILGVRVHSPLGVLGTEGGRRIGKHFTAMQQDLLEHADDYGLLGRSGYRATEREVNNGIVGIYYFRTVEGLNRFAHSPVHAKGMSWYGEADRGGGVADVGIWHETYAVPAGAWETIYKNVQPTGLARAVVKVEAEAGERWMYPVVSAQKGVLRSQYGRMGRVAGKEKREAAGVEEAEAEVEAEAEA